METLTVTKKRPKRPETPSRGPDAPDAGAEKGKEEETSTRLYVEDVRKLSELATMKGYKKIADAFRGLFGDLLDSSLIEAMERRTEEVRRRRT